MKRRYWAAAAGLCVFLILILQTAAPAEDAPTVQASGQFGEEMTWIFDSENGLTISGEGAVPDFVTVPQVPWYSVREQIVRVTARDGVTAVGHNAFNGCTALTELNFADSVLSIGNNAFQGCTALETADLPGRITAIGNNAFDGCTGLTAAELPARLETLGQSAFRNCTALADMTLPSRLGKLAAYTFQGCTALTKISLPAKVESIGVEAFGGCANLAEISLPAALDTIGARAFQNCTALTRLSIPESVTKINDYAFEGCTDLKALYYPGSEKQWRLITTDTLRSQLEELGTAVYYDGKTEADPVEPEKPSFSGEIARVAVSGSGIQVSIPEAETGSVLIGAVYDPDGKMLDAKFYTVTEGETQIQLEVNLTGAHTIAAYLLDPSGKPAAEAYSALAVE